MHNCGKMGRKWSFKYTFFILLLSTRASSISIKEVTDDQAVILSRGAVINPVFGVEVYDEMEPIFFLIPDIPDPPTLTDVECSDNIEARLCTIYDESKQALKDVQETLIVSNKILTTPGLKESVLFNPPRMDTKWFETMDIADMPSNSPGDDVQEAAGTNYVKNLQARLALRKILESNGTAPLTKREKRAIPFFVPVLRFAGKALASGQLQQFFQGLFTGDNGILSALSSFRAASPEDRKVFTEISKKVSEFESETRKLLIDVLQNTDNIEKQIKKMQEDDYVLKNNIQSFQEMVLLQQSLIADTARLVYVSTIYNLHFEAFSDCRSGKISPTFVPLSLLADQLKVLETNMTADKTLVIPSSEAFRMFKLSVADCLYDSMGGAVKIGIPLRRKKAAYKLFEYKPIQFAFNDFTCSLQTPATLVIKDVNSKDVFPITELDAEHCDISTGLCKLPMSTDMDTSSICIAILLKGNTAELIKENCKLQCTKRTKAEISKISDGVYVGIHLPPIGIEIRCPGETYLFTESISIGSTQFTLTCTMCKIFWNNIEVGSSSGIPCKEERVPKIETLLPVQFSDLKDLRPDGEDGVEKTVFTSSKEIINTQYDPETGLNYPPFEILPKLWTVAAVLWDWFQSLAIMYMFYRNGYLAPALGIGLNNAVAGVNADRYNCSLTTDVYIMLWAILVLLIIAVVPFWASKFFSFFKNLYNESIKVETMRREIERREERAISNITTPL